MTSDVPIQLLPGFWIFEDTCNIYLLKDGDRAIAIDFGSGKWLSQLEKLGIRQLEHVFLTHHHPDQCSGLLASSSWPFTVHAPAGEEAFLHPDRVREFHGTPRFGRGCPASYAVLPEGIPGIRYDMAGFSDLFWRNKRIRFLHTPGHGPNACSVILDQREKQVVFCGDAAHAGGTIRQPFHLEWDHWTGAGTLAAWEGVQRLLGIGIDLLCPSHGPVIPQRPRQTLRKLARRLLCFYHAKGSLCPGERDRYVDLEVMPSGSRRILPHLYQFGGNGYLLLSSSGEALAVDPCQYDMQALEALLGELRDIRPTAMLATHYHCDHCDGIPYMRERYGAKAWLHPRVAEPLADPQNTFLPWLPSEPILPDGLLPEKGSWRWQEYEFSVAPWPGQTWWHCVFAADIDRKRVLFGGDSFQPASRWNGTGGFCALNNSRFEEGFIESAKLALEWWPDMIATGHSTCYRFAPRYFRKIIRWARQAKAATEALSPTGDLEKDYYRVLHETP